jgi:hypothetical protein
MNPPTNFECIIQTNLSSNIINSGYLYICFNNNTMPTVPIQTSSVSSVKQMISYFLYANLIIYYYFN